MRYPLSRQTCRNVLRKDFWMYSDSHCKSLRSVFCKIHHQTSRPLTLWKRSYDDNGQTSRYQEHGSLLRMDLCAPHSWNTSGYVKNLWMSLQDLKNCKALLTLLPASSGIHQKMPHLLALQSPVLKFPASQDLSRGNQPGWCSDAWSPLTAPLSLRPQSRRLLRCGWPALPLRLIISHTVLRNLLSDQTVPVNILQKKFLHCQVRRFPRKPYLPAALKKQWPVPSCRSPLKYFLYHNESVHVHLSRKKFQDSS